MKISELNPYINNPRKNDKAVRPVMASIREFGFKVPITVDKNNTVVTGHTRLKAAVKLGMIEVPVIILDDLTDDQIKAFRLADNKTSEFAEWDFEALAIELRDIQINMDEFKFEMTEMFTEIKEDNFDIVLPKNPTSKYGDIYQLGKHRLMCGDSTIYQDILQLIDNFDIDMIFTDPPYNVDYEGKAGKIKNDKQSDEEFYNFLFSSFANMFKVLKPGGAIYCCHADTEGLNFRTAFKNAGFKLSECLIWVKNSLVFGRQDYHWRHEPILYGWKEGESHYFIDDRTQDTVWQYNKPKANDLHPTMKPIELVAKAIFNSSKKSQNVLDLFAGSGTTLIAAEQLSRIAYLMELDPKYVDVIIQRYEAFTGKKVVKIK